MTETQRSLQPGGEPITEPAPELHPDVAKILNMLRHGHEPWEDEGPVAEAYWLLQEHTDRVRKEATADGERFRAKMDEALRLLDHAAGTERRLSDELLALRAGAHQPAPTVFSLPAEPGPEVAELSDRDGDLWRPDDGWWFLDRDPEIRWVWHWLVVNFGPLSTTPPTGTETDHG